MKQLRARFLDAQVSAVPPATLNAAAHMLFELDRVDRVIDVGLGHLAEALQVGRIDISFGQPQDQELIAHGQVCRGGEWPSLVGTRLPNRHEVFQRVWRRANPVAFDDVADNESLGSLKAAFLSTGARAMLAQSLRGPDGVYAIVCADDMEAGRVWSTGDRATLGRFVHTFLGPILALSRELAAPRSGDKPSAAELDAIRLAAQGRSYKAIAGELGKSVRTVEFQLRSARRKTGAANQAELVRRCQPWL